MTSENKGIVLHVITRLIKGGADANTITSCLGLCDRKWDVTLVIGKHYTYNIDYLRQKGIRVIVVDELVRPISPIKDLKSFFRLIGICRFVKPDIVHTHTAKAGIVGRLAAMVAKVPYIVHSIHGSPVDSMENFLKKRVFSCIEKFATRYTDYFIAVGQEIYTKYCDQIGIKKPGCCNIVRSAFNTEKFAESHKYRVRKRDEFGLQDTDIAVGIVGRVAQQKGYEYFAEVCCYLAQTDYRFKFFSFGNKEDQDYFLTINNLTATLGKRITFVGEVNYEEIPLCIAAMDIIVHTALWEGLPRSVAECLVANKPVVTFEVDGVKEIIKHGENGFIIKSGDTTGVAQAVLYLISQGLDDFSERAKSLNQALFEEFKVDTMIKGIEDIYLELVYPKAIQA